MSIDNKLANLIYPCSIKSFFAKYYEKKHLYIARNNEKYYNSILTDNDIDLFFQNKNIPSSSLQVVDKGEAVSRHYWTDEIEKVNNDRLFTLFSQGKTLIINSGHKSIIKLVNFCSELEKELKFHLQFNIYITPHNSQGFNPHFDTHDVLILQVYGRKKWRLYNTPIELPTPKQHHLKYKDKYNLETPEWEKELKPGDLLYIPRGLVHDAITANTASIHVTLGLRPNCWFEILHEITNIAQDNLVFRKAIFNEFTEQKEIDNSKKQFKQMCLKLINDIDVNELLSRKYNDFLTSKNSEDENRFKDLINIEKLNLDSILSKRKNIIYTVNNDGERVCIKFYEKKIYFPLFIGSILDTMLQDDFFSVRDINKWIPNKIKLDIAIKLVKEGLLKVEKIN